MSRVYVDVLAMFAAGGRNLDSAMTAAGKRGFRGFTLPTRVEARVSALVLPSSRKVSPSIRYGGSAQARPA